MPCTPRLSESIELLLLDFNTPGFHHQGYVIPWTTPRAWPLVELMHPETFTTLAFPQHSCFISPGLLHLRFRGLWPLGFLSHALAPRTWKCILDFAGLGYISAFSVMRLVTSRLPPLEVRLPLVCHHLNWHPPPQGGARLDHLWC